MYDSGEQCEIRFINPGVRLACVYPVVSVYVHSYVCVRMFFNRRVSVCLLIGVSP